MTASPLVSLIIPTYNRPADLARALESLSEQPPVEGGLEVIVVDDGSNPAAPVPAEDARSFALRVLRQPNAGATEARCHGVRASAGQVLVFMDDDISLGQGALAALIHSLLQTCNAIVIGRLITRVPEAASAFARFHADEEPPGAAGDKELPFVACNTQLLAVRREDYDRIGGLQDPTGGWPNWDDVDFGYRAYRNGFHLIQAGGALATHWDRSLVDLKTAARRWYRASYAAARLFRVHPELQAHLPMFEDKAPLSPDDPNGLARRKILRSFASSRPVLWLIEISAALLARFFPGHGMLRNLYRWIIGARIYQGFRAGLQDLRAAD